jgi:GR25 family glycosyltransferase involved in LPS biosynthesis
MENQNNNNNMFPLSWNDVLKAPCFVINMDECTDRWTLAESRICNAGFTNIHRFSGIDARNAFTLAEAWARLGNPPFDPTDPEFKEYPGKQGCLLSHVFLFQKMVNENIPYATIFEDDILFHCHWDTLAPQYYETTPKQDSDIIYYGSQLDHPMDGHIVQSPVFCTHAYGITRKGAAAFLELILGASKGIRTIDCIIIDKMKEHFYHKKEIPFTWWVWSGLPFPDPVAFQDAKWARRNTGLVFQDPSLGTYVREW